MGDQGEWCLDIVLRGAQKPEYYSGDIFGTETVQGRLDASLAILRAYFDYLCERSEPSPVSENTLAEENETLETLLSVSREAVRERYRFNNSTPSVYISFKMKKHLIENLYIDSINRHIDSGDSRLTGLVCALNELCQRIGEFDTIVYVASGGAEAALMLAESRCYIQNPLPLRYSHLNFDDKSVAIPTYFSEEYLKSRLRNKRVVVVEDVICSGESAKAVLGFVKARSPRELYFACVNEQYCLESADPTLKQISKGVGIGKVGVA